MEPGLEDAGLGKGAVWRCRDPGKTLFDGGNTTLAEAMLVESLSSKDIIELSTLSKELATDSLQW